jgi:hypothetical protein
MQSAQTDWDNIPGDIHTDFGSDAFIDEAFAMPDTVRSTMPSTDLWPQDVTSFGPQEPLPPAEMINEL